MTNLATFNFDSLGRVQATDDGYAFYAGIGRHHLAIRVGITADWLPDGAAEEVPLALLTSTLRLTQPFDRHLATPAPTIVELRGYSTAHELAVDLDDNQLIGIEQARAGGDIVLHLSLQLTLLNALSLAYATRVVDATVRIRASRWVEMLDQAGTEVAVVIRVPSPLGSSVPDDATPSLTRAAEWLRDARDALRDGRHQACVASCRHALENLGALADMPGEAHVRRTNPSERSQDERWAATYYDTKSLASAAHHDDEITKEFVWTRADAEAILATTAALVRRLSV